MVGLARGNSILRRTINRAGVCLFLATLFGPARAFAEPIELANIRWPHGGMRISPGGEATGVTFFVEIGGDPFGGGIKLFEDLNFGEGHSSGNFSADSASDPDFLNFAATLTNGTNDGFVFMERFVPRGGGGGSGAYEFGLFGGSDFSGAQITRITLQVTSLDVVLSAPFNRWTMDARLIIEGNPSSVPEPASIYVVLCGLALVAGSAWSRRVVPIIA